LAARQLVKEAVKAAATTLSEGVQEDVEVNLQGYERTWFLLAFALVELSSLAELTFKVFE